MGKFFIETSSGQVATQRQLIEEGVISEGEVAPALPWHPVQNSGDASTMWFAVLRKEMRGVFIGTMDLRHGDHHASLLTEGWDEIPVDEIGAGV